MMKTITALTIIALAILGLPPLIHGSTADFQISVRIPAIVGLNFFPHDTTASNPSNDPVKGQDLLNIEEAVRNGEKIILRTLSVK